MFRTIPFGPRRVPVVLLVLGPGPAHKGRNRSSRFIGRSIRSSTSTSATVSSTTARSRPTAAGSIATSRRSTCRPRLTGAGRARQKMAFWLNAYNAFVLQTVIDQLSDHAAQRHYPAASIRQIPGAFEQTKHRVAGRSVTLDEIEKTILPEFKEPRLYLALGRGAVGSGRLRSEAYTGARLTAQLASIQSEFVNRAAHAEGRSAGRADVGDADHQLARGRVRRRATTRARRGTFAQRSPIERAHRRASSRRTCCRLEKEFVEQEPVQGGVPSVRLAAERSHGRRRGVRRRQNGWISGSPTRSRSSPARAAASGLASARALVAEGCRVCLCARGAGAARGGGARSRGRRRAAAAWSRRCRPTSRPPAGVELRHRARRSTRSAASTSS